MKIHSNLLLFACCVFMFGCPSKDPQPQEQSNRIPLARDGVTFVFFKNSADALPELPKCGGTPVSFQNVLISYRPATVEEFPKSQQCGSGMYWPRDNSYYTWTAIGSAVVLDFSKYSGIEQINIDFAHNCSGSASPPVAIYFYDLDDRLIYKHEVLGSEDRYQTVYIKKDFARLKEVRFINRCEGAISRLTARKL